ncbi:hypothetical protein [Clostridium botulinum]|nr:hypothetical protein [Clostridium botulinum]
MEKQEDLYFELENSIFDDNLEKFKEYATMNKTIQEYNNIYAKPYKELY